MVVTNGGVDGLAKTRYIILDFVFHAIDPSLVIPPMTNFSKPNKYVEIITNMRE